MPTSSTRQILATRLANVHGRIEQACVRSKRSPQDVTLIAVTKTISAEIAAFLPDLGVFHLGENRPQELWRKAAALPSTVQWHLIGHLQRNKIERTLPLTKIVHSADSQRVLIALESAGKPIDVLLEVNVSQEETKTGFKLQEIVSLAPFLSELKTVRLKGLMTLARHEENPENCRPTFIQLRQLRDQLQDKLGNAVQLPHLSMGMSNDFEVAIEEGATLIRLGTVLFGNLPGEQK